MSALLRTTACQIREDLSDEWTAPNPVLAKTAALLEVLADQHPGCDSDLCPQMAAAVEVCREYIGADCARELMSA